MVQDQWSTSTQFDLDGRKGVTKANNVNYVEEQNGPIICLPAQAVSNDDDTGPKDDYKQQNNVPQGWQHRKWCKTNGQRLLNSTWMVERE
jgi:hypothetical protein